MARRHRRRARGAALQMPTRQPGVHTVYCDESGFTGQNLLDAGQPFFAYSAVTIEPVEAAAFVDQLKADTKRIGFGDELKTKTFTGSERGRAILIGALHQLQGRARIIVADKKYALACKFYEYVFEPALQSRNSFFYERGFHTFVANTLYWHAWSLQNASAEQILGAFQQAMKDRDVAGLAALFGTVNAPDTALLKMIVDVALGNRDAIVEELDTLKGTAGVGKWVLDLTASSLQSLLAQTGEHYERLSVYCDRAKPLEAYPDLLASMIGRDERAYMTIGDRVAPITYNLAHPIELVDSKTHAGIQIADLVAGAAAYAWQHADSASDLLRAVLPLLAANVIFPDQTSIDFGTKDASINGFILDQLAKRARRGESALDDHLLKMIIASEQLYDRDHAVYGGDKHLVGWPTGELAQLP